MSQRGIEISRLQTDCFHERFPTHEDALRITFLIGFEQGTHQVHTVGNHDQDYPHVLSKRQQQITEILALHHGILLVELMDTVETLQDTYHRRAILRFDILHREFSLVDLGDEMYSLYRITFQADFLSENLSRLGSHFFLFFVCKSEFLHHIFHNFATKIVKS